MPHTPLVIDIDGIERNVRIALQAVGEKYRGRRAPAPQWTLQIKLNLNEIAEFSYAYDTCATNCKHPEWLYDVTWLLKDDEILIDVPLVLESEWDRNWQEVLYDFRKLIVARARLRVMVFVTRERVETENRINTLVSQVRGCNQSQSGDRYLFAVWEDVPTPGQFHFVPFTMP